MSIGELIHIVMMVLSCLLRSEVSTRRPIGLGLPAQQLDGHQPHCDSILRLHMAG